MDKELEELMQITIKSENMELSNMIKDITPIIEKRFTDLEIEADKSKEFSVVLYKKENIFVRFFKGLKYSIEKIRIMNHSNEFQLEQTKLTNK